MHIGRATGGTPWPKVAVPTWRLWDSQVKWPDLEPSRGRWQFGTLDKYVAIAEQHKTEILLPLATTPQWASSLPSVKSGWQAPGLTAPPADMEDWRAYVKQVATRYKGRIHAYEIWNEPNLKQFWIGSTDELVAMTKDAYYIIKSVDPDALVVSPAATTGAGISWLADFLSKGGGRYVDVIGYHCYVFPQAPEAVLPLIGKVKQLMKDNGIGEKPIWDTEIGWAEPKPFPSEELGAGYLARAFILNWSAGVQRAYWYMWDNRNWVTIETTAADNKTVLPAGRAYEIVQQWLSGASMDSCSQSSSQIWTCPLHRGNKSQWIVWTVVNDSKTFSLPSSWHARTFTPLLGESQSIRGPTVTLNQVPVLVSSPETAASSSATLPAAPVLVAATTDVAPAEPQYSPLGGIYPSGQIISLSRITPGEVIHYTLNGGQASASSPVYIGPLVLGSEQMIVRAVAVLGSATSNEVTATFTPESDSSPIPASLFGLTVLNFAALSPSMRFGTTRSWDAYPNLDWSDTNPAPGIYDFSYIDKFIALNQVHGTEVIYTLGRTPRWASSEPDAPGPYGPGQCAPPSDISFFEDFVRTLVRHVAGRIKYWELWNEPQSTNFYCGTIPSMVTMAREASKIIKDLDPTAQILSPGVTGGPGPDWLSSFLSEGGASYVDIIAFHGYWSACAEDVVNVIASYKSVMAARGVAGKPLWDTESSWAGFGNLGTPTSERQVGFIAKDYLLHWSSGVSRFVWYAYDGGPLWGGLWTSAKGESPAAKSFAETYSWLVGATLTSPCSVISSGARTCGLSRPGGYLAEAVWIPNSTATYAVPSHFTHYLDLEGGVHAITSKTITIGDEPILLQNETLP
ncbi:MAG: glycosyl hydrolase [Candidatus Acidiferrum sp.]